jgi:hypothetical protein
MDDATIEMLSRYIDGDLDPAEERDIGGRLAADPLLRSNLESLRELRSSLAVLAKNEEVPAELDALVEPLRRGRPEAVAARPWVRWLATAAVAVLGLSVIIEVNQKSSRQPAREAPRSRPGRPTEPTERFSLAPLPTSSVPPEDQLLGVSERLLASPIPEMEIEESPPLRVLGPLEAPPDAKGDLGGRKMGGEEMPAKPGWAAADTSARSTPSETAKARGELDEVFADDAPVTTGDAAPEGEKRTLQSVSGRPREREASNGQAQLFIFDAGKTSWQAFEPRARCDTGRYTVRVRVGGGVVREVWAVGRATLNSPSPPLCAGELVRGLAVSEVADGEYAAEVVVEPRGARGD